MEKTEKTLMAAAAAHRAGTSWRDIASWYGWRSAHAAEEEVRVRMAPQDWQRRRGPSRGLPMQKAWCTVRVRTGVYARLQALANAANATVASCVEEALLSWTRDQEATGSSATGAPTPRTHKTRAPVGDDALRTDTPELARGPISEEGEDDI